MNQIDLISECGRLAHFDGVTYQPEFDYERLGAQLRRVYLSMRDSRWRTLSEIAAITGDRSEAAVSARLRDLRKAKFGGFTVERRRRGDPKLGIWEYQLKTPGGSEPSEGSDRARQSVVDRQYLSVSIGSQGLID